MVQGIDMVRGTTVPISLEITDENGTPYALKSGEKILFGVKRHATDDAALFVKAAVAGDEIGTYVVTIYPEDTLELEAAKHYYDVGLESGGNYYNIVEPSPFMILPNITKKGDAYA